MNSKKPLCLAFSSSISSEARARAARRYDRVVRLTNLVAVSALLLAIADVSVCRAPSPRPCVDPQEQHDGHPSTPDDAEDLRSLVA